MDEEELKKQIAELEAQVSSLKETQVKVTKKLEDAQAENEKISEQLEQFKTKGTKEFLGGIEYDY